MMPWCAAWPAIWVGGWWGWPPEPLRGKRTLHLPHPVDDDEIAAVLPLMFVQALGG